jgi:hypothetical protein
MARMQRTGEHLLTPPRRLRSQISLCHDYIRNFFDSDALVAWTRGGGAVFVTRTFYECNSRLGRSAGKEDP